MVNLREQVELDLETTLEGDFGLPVTLVAPDGSSQSVTGQVLYDTLTFDPEYGAEVVIHRPVVTVRRSSLTRVPAPGEAWAVKIPLTPSTSATLVSHMLDRVSEDGGSIGFVRLYLVKAEQSA